MSSPSRYTLIWDLDRVDSLSFTIARTVGLELLMVPVGLTEVIVTLDLEAPGPTPLKPPALLAPLLPPALLFWVDLSESRLLRLPMRTSLLAVVKFAAYVALCRERCYARLANSLG